MRIARHLRFFGAALLFLALAACDNAEQRAQGHIERGEAFVEAGELNKAVLEYRNALQLNPDSLTARRAIARIYLDQQNFNGAVGNFLAVIDKEPENLEARLVVGRILLQVGETEEAIEHIDALGRIAPQNLEVRALQAVLNLRQGRTEEAVEGATALLAEDPGNIAATLVLVEQEKAIGNLQATIPLIDDALTMNPDNLDLHVARLQILEALDDQVSIGAQLERMAGLFPDQPRVAQARVQWFLNQGAPKDAIEAQRVVAELYPEDPSHALDVAALLNQFEGREIAQAELERLAGGDAHKVVFVRALAEFEFSNGDAQSAIMRLAELSKSDIPQSDRNDMDVQRAYILYTSGDQTTASETLDVVLSDDPDHIEGLKLRATFAIDDDRPDDAITDLRAALGLKARDPSILMLLAQAHERSGSVGLAQDRLALAVQASGAGVVESLTYADLLIRTQKPAIAQDVLEDALAKRGEVSALLGGLGNAQLAQSDWSGANDTAARLEAMTQDPQAVIEGQELRLAVLGGQQKFEESIGLLRSMWAAEGERTNSLENLVGSYLRTGQIDKATQFLRDIMVEEPKSLRANLLLGAVLAFSGDPIGAEAQYTKVINEHPDLANGYGALSTLLRSQGRVEEADAILLDGINKADNAERLLFFQASRLEEQQNFDGAIAIYEQLYAANKLSDVLANNLASLLSEFGSDPDSLERAFNIARRLRDNPEPAFQDTYGWILYQRGEYERALQPLRSAADGASTNPIVLYHLGMTLEKLGQTEPARDMLTRALELGGNRDVPQLAEARETLESLPPAVE